ncbi:MAG: amidohydrolase family protein [Nitrospiraceae bacterium]
MIFSHGGLTATGGHPIHLYEDILRQSRYEPMLGHLDKGWFNNRGYFIIDTEADLLDKWNTIMAGKPDFLKTFLIGSELDDTKRDRGPVHTRKGLDPTLLHRIVALAHRDGPKVSTHVEKAGDFHHAVMAGVDEINHLPGWLVSTPHDAENARLSDDDARRAARRGVVVVTTTVSSHSMPGAPGHPAHGHAGAESAADHSASRSDLAVQALAREIQIHNLRVLHRHGVAIVIGSDHAETSLAEVLNLHALNVFDNLTLLKMWCETTPRAIFPQRNIGLLQEGYEASFLVLGGNPLDRFEEVTRIKIRFKEGHPLSLSPY